MKKKFIFAMSVAATMFLASCGNTTPSSTEAPKTETTSASVTEDAVESVKITGETTVEVGKTTTLVAEVAVTGSASKLVDWSSSETSVATVNDTGVVTGLTEGTTTITATSVADPTKKDEVTVTVIAEQKAEIKDITASGTYKMTGVVSAKNTKSFILSDGEASIMVYLNTAPQFEIGDLVEVEGEVETSTYSAGMFQFNSDATVTKVEGTKPTLPAAVELTSTIVDGWTQASSYATTEMKLYKWSTTVTKSGSYFVTRVSGTDVAVEPVYLDNKAFPLVEGAEYDVEGYFAGYRVPSSGSGYAQIVLTKAEVAAGTVSITGEKSIIEVEKSVELTASIAGNETGTVTWSLKEDDASSIATLASEGNTATVTGVAPGKVTVVATYEAKSAEYAVEVISAAAKELPAEGLTINTTVLENAGFAPTAGSYNADGDYSVAGLKLSLTEITKTSNADYKSDKTSLAYDCLQAQKTNASLVFKDKIASFSTLTIKFYNTYATEARAYIPTVKVNDSEVTTSTDANSSGKWVGTEVNSWETTTTYSNKSSYPDGITVTKKMYEYTLVYDLSSYKDAVVGIYNDQSSGGAMYFGDIVFAPVE